jgi:hypothetical protein
LEQLQELEEFQIAENKSGIENHHSQQVQKNCVESQQKSLKLNNLLWIFEANKMERKESLRSESKNFAEKMMKLKVV